MVFAELGLARGRRAHHPLRASLALPNQLIRCVGFPATGKFRRPETQLKSIFGGRSSTWRRCSSFGISHQCCRAPKHKDQHWEQRHCQGTSVSTWVLYRVLNIKMNQHRRPQSKIKPPPVHRNHSPTLCGHSRVVWLQLEALGFKASPLKAGCISS